MNSLFFLNSNGVFTDLTARSAQQTEAVLDGAIEVQRLQIEAQLKLLKQGGLERFQRGPHKPVDAGSNPVPATNLPAHSDPGECSETPTRSVNHLAVTEPAVSFCGSGSKSSTSEALPHNSSVASGPAVFSVWMCSWCKRPFNARGEHVIVPPWAEPEIWSHGMCATCFVNQMEGVRTC